MVQRARWGLAALALLGVVLALYGRVLGYPFLYDDLVLIGTNEALGDGSTLFEALTSELFHFAPEVRPSPYWRPVVTLSYYLDQWVGGGDPRQFHLTNLVALAAAGLGLASLLQRISANQAPALLLALIFLAHPLQIEGAASAAARTDLLCAALGLWALSARRPLVSCALVLLACGAKEIGVVLPLVAWLMDRRDTRWRWQLFAVGLFLAVRGAVMSGTVLMPDDSGGGSPASVWGAGARVCFWLGRLLVPTPMGPAADLVPATGLFALLGWLTLPALGWVAWKLGPGRRGGAALVLLPLLMVSGLLQSTVRYGDALTVLPWAGLLVVLGADLRSGVKRTRGLLLVGFVLLASLTSRRLPEWASSETLWEAAHARAPADRVVALNLARVRLDTNPQAALDLVENGTWPTGSREAREAAALGARALLALGREDEALPWLSRAVADDPEAAWANGMSCVLLAARGSRAAGPVCELAVQFLADDPDVLNAMGISRVGLGGPAEALPWFTRAAKLAPDRPEFVANRDRARAALSEP